MDIQSSVDPQAYAQRQMRMNAANSRLGKLYNVDPTAFAYNTPSNTYAMPGSSDLPDLNQLKGDASAIASLLSTAAVNKSGHPASLIRTGSSTKCSLRYPDQLPDPVKWQPPRQILPSRIRPKLMPPGSLCLITRIC